MTVLDIGAHVGLHTLRFCQRAGATGRVLAVEPSPANAALLRKHLNWNKSGNSIVIEAAVGEYKGSTEFAYRPDATDPGGFANSMAYDVGGKNVRVPVTTIDELCGAITPGIIKIDVEGAELLVIRGARKVLTSCSPVLLIAVHPELMAALDTSPAELVSELSGLGYAGYHLDGRTASDPGFEEIIFEKAPPFAGFDRVAVA
jgi:FkbM family methyltransferase